MSTRAELLAEIAAQFPDNTSRSITPAKLRQVCENLANSATVPDTDGDALTAEIEAAAEAAASAEVSAHVAATDPHGDRAAAAADATTKANAAQAAAEATAAAALAAYTPPAQTVTADSITNASTSGKAVLTGTPEQGQNALGSAQVFTTAQLNALTAGTRPSVAYCSDCLVPEGVGASVIWNGSSWVSTCSMFPITTDWIDYFRAEFGRGGSFTNRAGNCTLETAQNTGVVSCFTAGVQNTASIDYVSFNAPVSRWANCYSTTSNGGARLAPALLSPAYAGRSAAVYLRCYAAASELSDGTNAFNFRVSFSSTGAYALAANEYGIAYDPQNALGGLNAGGSQNLIAFSRRSSVNNDLAVSGTAFSIDRASPTTIEVLIVRGVAIRLYVNGKEVANFTGNQPADTEALIPLIAFNRSASTASRGVYVGYPYRSTRYTDMLP